MEGSRYFDTECRDASSFGTFGLNFHISGVYTSGSMPFMLSNESQTTRLDTLGSLKWAQHQGAFLRSRLYYMEWSYTYGFSSASIR